MTGIFKAFVLNAILPLMLSRKRSRPVADIPGQLEQDGVGPPCCLGTLYATQTTFSLALALCPHGVLVPGRCDCVKKVRFVEL